MKNSILITLVICVVAFGHVFSGDHEVQDTVKNDNSPRIILMDRNNKAIEDKVASSSISAIMIVITDAEDSEKKHVFIVKKGRYQLPGQEPRTFVGPRINVGNSRPGKFTIIVDEVVTRNEDGTLSPVVLENNTVTFEVI